MPHLNQATRRLTISRLGLLGAVVAALLAPAGSYAIEILNQQGAKEIAENAKLPGSVSTGWRVFQQRCASCHGPAAQGTVKAPDLLPRVREMGAERFSNLVLKRYDWSATPAAASSPQTGAQAVMPAWQSNPMVNAHIVDLYAYLSARSEGTQGPGQPAQ
ncbi:c-type cytochrome [Roseateles albus]|uniref:Cytochrome c n=1 Tax=Roseateles albus TaxID=2987525 RepID=A0ABT5KHZ5_9BURK|nr:cytochrome c [Roseateles albus]MDC8772575.1 cytochrome c [Roseateles albus]